MKAVFISILLLVGADWTLNHGAASRRVISGLAHFGQATSDAAGDSIFAK